MSTIVRLAIPAKRPIQLRYECPESGKKIRISTGTRDLDEAEAQRVALQAKLLLGITSKRKERSILGPNMPWEDFWAEYEERHISKQRGRSRESMLSRLRLAEKLVRPKTLSDMADREALLDLRERFRQGEGSRFGRELSINSVRSYMASVMAALHWAAEEGWLESVPKLPKMKMPKIKVMKGRPITQEEFERLLATVPRVTPHVPQWRYILRGLLASGLRLEELTCVSWDDPEYIRPLWNQGRFPVLSIPHEQQKNETEEDIPLLPAFEALLKEVPEGDRFGWVFHPIGIKGKRTTAAWAGKLITRMGKLARIVVSPAKRGAPPKFASAHDLRRTCAERLIDAGVPDHILMRVMRHEDLSTTRKYYARGTVQRAAAVLHSLQNDPSVPQNQGTLSEAPEYRLT